MLRFLLGPRWLAWHAALVAVLAAFTLLGLWQLDRFEHHDRPSADLRPASLADVTTPGRRLEGVDVARRVTAQGSYDVARTLLVPGRRSHGRTGLFVVSPLRTSAGVLAVLRGWVPSRASSGVRPPAGDVSVAGRLQPSEDRGSSGVDPLAPLPGDEIAYVATVTVLEAWPYPPDLLYDGYVVATAERPAVRPARAAALEQVAAQRPTGGVSRWRNLAYALQWWLFAGAAVFFWGSVVRRAAAVRRAPRLPRNDHGSVII